MAVMNNRVKNVNVDELKDRLVAINRVTKVTGSGRRSRPPDGDSSAEQIKKMAFSRNHRKG